VVKKDKNAIFLSLFSGQVQRARKHAKSGGTYSCIFIHLWLYDETFCRTYYILLLENTNTTLSLQGNKAASQMQEVK
jgi:hypothetical protein